jgi:hypothetical protein
VNSSEWQKHIDRGRACRRNGPTSARFASDVIHAHPQAATDCRAELAEEMQELALQEVAHAQ